jgi:hypothetical protein
MSSPFVFLAFGPFLYCTEIWKRIQFINSWGTFQVIFSFLYIYGNPRTNNFWVYIVWYLQDGREFTVQADLLHRESRNPGRHVAKAIKSCTVAPNRSICGSSVFNLLHGPLLVRRTCKWLLDSWENLDHFHTWMPCAVYSVPCYWAWKCRCWECSHTRNSIFTVYHCTRRVRSDQHGTMSSRPECRVWLVLQALYCNTCPWRPIE